ncbi:hypothetical protein AB0I28_20300 [Phytomonospora sp. NPDC050363]|uniref:hypothetical protein n=1 Tax=Phytomonospora sp. NPDC050363 TaxID=3155642 RepID=UPI0033EAD7ED
MSNHTPSKAVLEKARELDLGPLERRMRRRPGMPGAFICVVLAIVGMNFVVNGPYNGFGYSVMGLIALIIVWWTYVWIRRVGGGLYIFRGGCIDAAGLRLIVVRWSDVLSIKTGETMYAVNSLPVGSSFKYAVEYRVPHNGNTAVWELNTTYPDLVDATTLISRRSGVTITANS